MTSKRAGRNHHERPASPDPIGPEERHARFRLALESSPAGSLLVDAHGTIVFANRLVETMFGYARDELLGRSVETLVPEALRAQHAELRGAYMQDPVSRTMGAGRELRGLRKDGQEIHIEVGLSVIPSPEETLILGVVVDLTDRVMARQELERQAEELRRSNEELERFAHVASHDLKAPLRAIGHLATWVREDAGDVLPPTSAEHLETLLQRVGRLERLLDDLLAFSRAGRTRGATPEQVDTGQLVRDVVELSGLPEGFQVEVGELPVLHTLRASLEQVFRNLVQNAVKHHDLERGRILVDASVNDPWAEFWVEDDGPGIPEDFNERIFGMFETLRPRDEVEGSGMGLAIAKRSVEAMGGSIRAERPGERGTRFTFSWPLHLPDRVEVGR